MQILQLFQPTDCLYNISDRTVITAHAELAKIRTGSNDEDERLLKLAVRDIIEMPVHT